MSVTFEVDRFEWAADDRLELEGRWFGLRGRRFIRPTLDVQVDGESRRLLALMEHKPWAALDGEDWVAAFFWDGERGDVAAELAVGSDLSFELPRPGGGSPGKVSPKRAVAAAANAAQAVRKTPDDGLKRKLVAAERARNEAVSDAAALRRALQQKERTVRDLSEQLDAARAEVSATAIDAATAATESNGDATRLAEELERVRGELAATREEAAAGADTAPAASAEVEDLRRQLDAAVAARDAAIEHAEQAKRERYEAAGTLAAAEREARETAHALELGHAERDELRATARAARQERDAAVRQRDQALAELESTRRARDTAQLARDAERAERPQVAGVAELVRRRGPRALARLSAARTDDEVLALRFAALVALSIVCLLVGIWFLAV